jgi:dynein heavy chain
MRRSLKELDLGLSGELQMSERMEDLFNSLYLGRVPASWTKLAYPSQRSLSSWMDNLIARAGQLQAWVEEPVSIPLVVQITYMFNPQSFLTAIMQKTAQKQKLELDKLVIQVRTKKTFRGIRPAKCNCTRALLQQRWRDWHRLRRRRLSGRWARCLAN